MITFTPAAWNEGLRPWLYQDPDISADAVYVEGLIVAEEAVVMVAKGQVGEVVGLMAVSVKDRDLMVHGVSGRAGVMRAAIHWSKEMVRRLGLDRAVASTRKPAVVYHMARAGARLEPARLTWEP